MCVFGPSGTDDVKVGIFSFASNARLVARTTSVRVCACACVAAESAATTTSPQRYHSPPESVELAGAFGGRRRSVLQECTLTLSFMRKRDA